MVLLRCAALINIKNQRYPGVQRQTFNTTGSRLVQQFRPARTLTVLFILISVAAMPAIANVIRQCEQEKVIVPDVNTTSSGR